MPLDTDKNAFWANLETRSVNNGWDGTAFTFPNDAFNFLDAKQDAKDSVTPISDALHAALESRDLEGSGIEDLGAFEAATPLLQDVFESDIETSADAESLLGDKLNLTFVDSLTTTDGVALKGAAILGSDEIVLDSTLAGEELRDTLIEEITETAYQQAYNTASAGDFGAEVLATLKGEEDEEVLATYSEDIETDTVETEFGTAEAALDADAFNGEDMEQFITNMENGNEGIDIVDVTYHSSDEFYDLYDRAGAGDESTYETTFWGDEFLEAATLGGGGFDFNGDGISGDQYYGFLNADDTPTADVVSRASDYEYTPIPGLSDDLTYDGETPGQGRFGWSYSEGTTFSVSEEINYSEGVTVDGAVSSEIAGLTFSGGVASTSTEGGSITTSNTWTSTTDSIETYVADVDQYEPEVPIYYGEHTVVADVNMTTNYNLWILAVDENGNADAFFNLDVDDTRVVEDYLVNVTRMFTTGDGLSLDPDIALSFDEQFGFG